MTVINMPRLAPVLPDPADRCRWCYATTGDKSYRCMARRRPGTWFCGFHGRIVAEGPDAGDPDE